jgi:hypothetical protein
MSFVSHQALVLYLTPIIQVYDHIKMKMVYDSMSFG